MSTPSLILQANTNNGRTAGAMLAYRPSLTENGIIPIEFPFSRTTTGMERLSDGLWRDAAINMPRRFWDGTKYSYLFEPTRTNLKLRSNDWTNSTYNLNNTTQSQSAIQPLFNAPALQVRETATNSQHTIQIQPDATLVIGQVYTRSFYVKAVGTRQVINFGDAGQINNDARVNIVSKTIVSQGTNVSSISFFDEQDGVIRIMVTFTATAVIGRPSIALFLDNTTLSYLGNVNEGVDIYNIQYELGNSATSPIITEGSAVQRTADVPLLTGANALIGQQEGVVYFEFFHRTTSEQLDVLAMFNTSTQYLIRFRVSGNILSCVYNNNASALPFCPSITVVNNQINKVAVKYNALTKTATSFINGVNLGNTVNVMDYPPLTDRIQLGVWFGSSNLYLQELKNYKALLSDAECIALTTL